MKNNMTLHNKGNEKNMYMMKKDCIIEWKRINCCTMKCTYK